MSMFRALVCGCSVAASVSFIGPTGTPASWITLSQYAAGCFLKAQLHLGLQRVVCIAVRIREEPLVLRELRSADGAAQLAKHVIIAAADHKLCVGRLERIERRHIGMTIARPLRGLTDC